MRHVDNNKKNKYVFLEHTTIYFNWCMVELLSKRATYYRFNIRRKEIWLKKSGLIFIPNVAFRRKIQNCYKLRTTITKGSCQ